MNLHIITDERLRDFTKTLINYFKTNGITADPEITADTASFRDNEQRNLVYRENDAVISVDINPLFYPNGPYGPAIARQCGEVRQFFGLSLTPTISWEDFTQTVPKHDPYRIVTPTGHVIHVPRQSVGPVSPIGPSYPDNKTRYRNVGGVFEEGTLHEQEGRLFVYVKQNLFGGFWLEMTK